MPADPELVEAAPQAAKRRRNTANAGWLRALELTAGIADAPLHTLPVVIDELGDRFGDASALLSAHHRLSFRELAEQARRYARWALAEGLAPGGCVALMMPNCPEYLAIWLGITRVGGVVALLNTNLSGRALAHSIGLVEPQAVIAAHALVSTVAEALPLSEARPRLWCVASEDDEGGGGEEVGHRLGVAGFPAAPLAASESPRVTISDRALYIYTSGTTGPPKAANISHRRIMMWSHWFAGIMQVAPDDRMYDCLPMYHSIGGIVAPAATLIAGGSVAISARFSVKRFWEEVLGWDCTMFQYIGELCRYLTNAPPTDRETEHRLRLCCGNGLRAEVWRNFQARFRIPQIIEFYAATEGTFSLYNLEGKIGAIGRIPAYLTHRFPAAIVRIDLETEEPIRDAHGHCIACGRDETGEAIGRIANGGRSVDGLFEGYTSGADSERKIIRNVFADGDAWFRTGDLMRRDGSGYFYFVDRMGDTFRWKGENVATTEVGEVVTGYDGVAEAAVYGVAVPGTEGRAGMAAIVADAAFDIASLGSWLGDRLPAYARPLFVRICDSIEASETFKPKKHRLAREGFDPGAIDDPLYFYDAERRAYVPLDRTLFERIGSGEIRL